MKNIFLTSLFLLLVFCSFSQTKSLFYKEREFYKMGDVKFKNKDYKGAIALYSKGLSINPSNLDFYYLIGQAKELLNDYHGAIEEYSRGIKTDPENSFLYEFRALAKQKIGDNIGAIFDFNKINYESLTFNRAISKQNINDYYGAISDYCKSIAKDSKLIGTFLKIELHKSNLLEDNKPLESLDKIIKLNPKLDTIYFLRGIIRNLFKDTLGAFKDFNKVIELNPKYKGVHKLLGDIKVKILYMGVDYATDEYYKEIENIDKQNMGVNEYLELADLYSSIGVAEFKNIFAGNVVDRDKCLDKALLNLKISTILNPNIFENYYYSGRIKLLQNESDVAINNFYDASGIEVNSDLYFYKGMALVNIGEDTLAINCFKRCLGLDSSNTKAYKLCASTYYDIKYYRCAILYYTNAIILNHFDYELFYSRGKAKGKLKDYQGAIEDYTKAIKIKSNHYNSYIKRARANFKLNNFLSGILDWIKYIYYSIIS